MSAPTLIDLLEARSGLVCAVGAGGKKTTLYRLAQSHPGRVGLTSTVFTTPVPATLEAATVIADAGDLLDAVRRTAGAHRIVAFAQPSEKRARYAGVSAELIAAAHRAAGFDVTLVKADGARMRWIKAPSTDEPVIPEPAATVLALVSARAIGATLGDEIAHRVESLEAVTGARRGERIEPGHVARLLGHPEGALKGVGPATVIPILNMVEDEATEAAAIEAAERALALTDRFDRVVLAAMRRPEPIVRVVER